MRHTRFAVLTFGLVLAAAATSRADDAAVKAVVDKALKAHGGEATLAKLPASTVTFKGTIHTMGQKVPFTGQVSSQAADKLKIDIEVEAGGQKVRIVNVINGDKGWTKFGEDVKELGKDELTEALEKTHSGWVTTLAPLKNKELTLAPLGEIKVDDKPAVGIKVTSKGKRDVDLYFDKESGLLVKSETHVKDEGSGQEVTEESFYGDYKEVQGTKQSKKITVKREGKLYVEGEVTDHHLAERLDDNTFAKP